LDSGGELTIIQPPVRCRKEAEHFSQISNDACSLLAQHGDRIHMCGAPSGQQRGQNGHCENYRNHREIRLSIHCRNSIKHVGKQAIRSQTEQQSRNRTNDRDTQTKFEEIPDNLSSDGAQREPEPHLALA
jgi:hypothetical protein